MILIFKSYILWFTSSMRNVTDYDMLGKADRNPARAVVENASQFVDHCEAFLTTKGYL